MLRRGFYGPISRALFPYGSAEFHCTAKDARAASICILDQSPAGPAWNEPGLGDALVVAVANSVPVEEGASIGAGRRLAIGSV